MTHLPVAQAETPREGRADGSTERTMLEEINSEDPDYGDDAQLDRDFASLTQKQQNVVSELADRLSEIESDADDSALYGAKMSVSESVGCSTSYVTYCTRNFPHIIRRRARTTTVAADGGEGSFEVTVSAEDAFKMVRLLPEDLSQTVYRQIRRSGD